MTLPLYKQNDAPGSKPDGANTGLWYDKFCNQWGRDQSKKGREAWTLESFKPKGRDEKPVNPKLDWIKTVVSQNGAGNASQLEEHAARLTNLLNAYDQTPRHYTLESPFVTGLGRAHPVENGFAWHHTLGTPYLPGSSVKGMVRAWAAQWEGVDRPTLKQIFGSEDDKDKNFQVGSVIFLDAIPTKPVQLKADVMTPHYGPWYRGEAPPADWHSPIPVPFLVVEQGQTFLFGVLPRSQDETSREDCERVKAWLGEALCWLGAGAKTAVGYGRFASPEAKATASSTATSAASVAPPPQTSPADDLIAGLRGVGRKDLKVRAQGFVDRLLRLELPEEERRRAAAEMLKALEQSRVPQVNKLNAYRQLDKLRGE